MDLEMKMEYALDIFRGMCQLLISQIEKTNG